MVDKLSKDDMERLIEGLHFCDYVDVESTPIEDLLPLVTLMQSQHAGTTDQTMIITDGHGDFEEDPFD